MTELDQIFPGEAFDAIEEYGTTVQFVRKVKGAYGPATSKYPVVDDVKVVKVVFDKSEQGKLKFYVAAMAVDFVDPSTVDRFEVDGLSYGTFTVVTYKSGELDCLYEIEASR